MKEHRTAIFVKTLLVCVAGFVVGCAIGAVLWWAFTGDAFWAKAESSEPRLDRIEVTSRDAAITLQAGEEFGASIMLHVHAGVINFVDEDFALQVVKPYCYGRWYFGIEGYAACLRRALAA